METTVTTAVITYLKYTDTTPACLHGGWQNILDAAGTPESGVLSCIPKLLCGCTAGYEL